jgi:hypothetical protein
MNSVFDFIDVLFSTFWREDMDTAGRHQRCDKSVQVD